MAKSTQPVSPERSEAAKVLGREGGRAGWGDAKRRSPEHYQKLSEQRILKKLKKQLGE